MLRFYQECYPKKAEVREKGYETRKKTKTQWGIAKLATASQENTISSWVTGEVSEEKGGKLTCWLLLLPVSFLSLAKV